RHRHRAGTTAGHDSRRGNESAPGPRSRLSWRRQYLVASSWPGIGKVLPRFEIRVCQRGRSGSRVLSRRAEARRGWPSIWGRRSPDGSCGRPEGWAAPLSPVTEARVAPSYLALLRVEFARFTPSAGLRRRPASSLWHWSSPHGGRALPATLRCGARTFLTPTRRASTARGHPTASLTRRIVRAGARGPDRESGSGPDDHRGRPTRCRAIDGLVREGIGHRVLGARDVGRGPAVEA